MKAWHFLRAGKRLGYRDWRLVKVGETYSVDYPNKLKLCEYGMHASKKPIDALKYAPGPILCRVELSGKILEDDDKLCAEHRKVLWMFDATDLLHTFACDVAEDALSRLENPDPRSVAAIKAKRKYVQGEISDSDLYKARAAAGAAAWNAAAGAAAWNAAAGAAAWAAAYSARDAARDATRDKLNLHLEQMIEDAILMGVLE